MNSLAGIVNDLSAQEKFPIGTVVSWKDGILRKEIKKGIVAGYHAYQPSYEYPYGVDLIVEEYKNGMAKNRYFIIRASTFIGMLENKSVGIIHLPAYMQNFRKSEEENPLLSFPKGTRILLRREWVEGYDLLSHKIIGGKVEKETGISKIEAENNAGVREWFSVKAISKYNVDDITGQNSTLEMIIDEYLS